MTTETIHGGFLKTLIRVAGLATDLTMPACQRKVRSVVIEFGGRPGPVDVAVTAIRAESSLVGIVPSVTVRAVERRVPVSRVQAVTAQATNQHVRARKCEVGLVVVKGLIVQADYVVLPTLVIGVATPALASRYPPHASMVSLTRLYVRGNILVAIETESVLTAFTEKRMTTTTVRFVLGVSLDQWTWHHQPLKHTGPLASRKGRHHHRRGDGRQASPTRAYDHPRMCSPDAQE